MSKSAIGSTVDDFLKAEGIFKEVQAQAIEEVMAWLQDKAMKTKKQRIPKNTLDKTRTDST